MSKQAAQVLADRVARDAARSRFDTHYAALKADVDTRGIGGRILDEAYEKAKVVFDETVEVVEENPIVVGGTLAALVLWVFKEPITAWIANIFDKNSK